MLPPPLEFSGEQKIVDLKDEKLVGLLEESSEKNFEEKFENNFENIFQTKSESNFSENLFGLDKKFVGLLNGKFVRMRDEMVVDFFNIRTTPKKD